MTPAQALEFLAAAAMQSLPLARAQEYNAAYNALKALVDRPEKKAK